LTHVDTQPRTQETDVTMHDRYDRNDSLVSWMIAGGARLDEPDPRHLSHLVALRDARRESRRSLSPVAWLTARLAPKATVAASASGVASAALTAPSTNGCAPA
jgi:hypothetical protein